MVSPSFPISSIPRSYAQMLVDACSHYGHNPNDLLEFAGVSQQQWASGNDISAVHFGRMYTRMLWLMRDESFGMLSGEHVPNGSFRMMCLSVIHCRDIRQVIKRVADFCDIAIGYQTKPDLIESNSNALIRIQPTAQATNKSSLNSREHLGRTRTFIVMWCNFLSWLAGRTIPVKAVHLCHPDAEAAYLLSINPATVENNMPEDGLLIEKSALDWPVVQNEAHLGEFLANAPYHLLCAPPNLDTYSSKVANILSRAGSVSGVRAADVASDLACSEATLRRRLASENTSFQALKDQHRQRVALRNLSRLHMPLKEIAILCGFDNTAEFNRAFRRWTGDAPGNYRKKLLPPL